MKKDSLRTNPQIEFYFKQLLTSSPFQVIIGVFVLSVSCPTIYHKYCMITYIMFAFLAGIAKDYCTWEKFEAKCGLNEVVMMDAARYGRMRIGKCVKRDFGYLSCAANVLTHMDSLCSGRRECSVTIPDQTLRDMRPCSELEAYLQASYSCVKGRQLKIL